MNLIQFWQDQVTKWNNEQKCGLCWEFDAPLTQSAVELHQPTKGTECCVQVLLVRDQVPAFNMTNNYNNVTGLLTNVACNTSFQLLFLMQMDMGTNNYNEIKNHPVEQGKWVKLGELENCIGCDMNLDFCELIGTQYRVTQWQARQEKINMTSSNYSGYRLTVNFQTIR